MKKAKSSSVRWCQRRLVILWSCGAAPAFILLAVQTTMGKYGERAEDAWSWFLPTILPTLALVFTVVTADALRRSRDKSVSPFYFGLAAAVSAFYLILVNLVLVLGSLTVTPIASYMRSNLFLGPVQGLSAIALTVFFVSREDATAAAEPVQRAATG